MRVILLGDIAGLGREGEMKDVADGYGRNFLIARKLAVQATRGAVRQYAEIKRRDENRQEALKKEAESLKRKIESLEMRATLKTGEHGEIFGSIQSRDIAEFLGKNGITVSNRAIGLKESLKRFGEYEISIRLHPDISANLKILLSAQSQ